MPEVRRTPSTVIVGVKLQSFSSIFDGFRLGDYMRQVSADSELLVPLVKRELKRPGFGRRADLFVVVTAVINNLLVRFPRYEAPSESEAEETVDDLFTTINGDVNGVLVILFGCTEVTGGGRCHGAEIGLGGAEEVIREAVIELIDSDGDLGGETGEESGDVGVESVRDEIGGEGADEDGGGGDGHGRGDDGVGLDVRVCEHGCVQHG